MSERVRRIADLRPELQPCHHRWDATRCAGGRRRGGGGEGPFIIRPLGYENGSLVSSYAGHTAGLWGLDTMDQYLYSGAAGDGMNQCLAQGVRALYTYGPGEHVDCVRAVRVQGDVFFSSSDDGMVLQWALVNASVTAC